jgi:secretion/DNA translocation related TadE-like protein
VRVAGGDRSAGSATVWLVAAIVVVVAALSVGLALGGVATAERQAAGAADAAALAAAVATIEGPGAACGRAATLAALNQARLTSCDVSGAVVTVSVVVRLPALLARFGAATGRARAGPASMTSPPPGERPPD